jgi:hypothetical protein
VQGGYGGHLSSFGETIVLSDQNGTVVSSFRYIGEPSDVQRFLAVSEIMFNPSGDGLAEFIELVNTSGSVTLDLTGVRFSEGIVFDFSGGLITTLPPGGRVLIVRDLAAFEQRYGSGLPVSGSFAAGSALNNGGEILKLEDAQNGTVLEFRYGDTAPWPEAADGQGYSLVLAGAPAGADPSQATSWRQSAFAGGNPGGSDTLPPPADPAGDADGNGVEDLLDYGLGNGLGDPVPPQVTFAEYDVGGAPVTLPAVSYPVNIGADFASVGVELSSDLAVWADASDEFEHVSTVNLGDGRAVVTLRWVDPATWDSGLHFVRVKVGLR